MSVPCTRPGCDGGEIDADGYCTECGLAPAPTGTAQPSSAPTGTAQPSAATTGSAGATAPGTGCARPGCTGEIDADGYCTECGLAPASPAPAPAGTAQPSAGSTGPTTTTGPATTGPTAGGSRRSFSVRGSRSTGGTRTRGRLGAGLVAVPPIPRPDPRAAVLDNPEVPERKRFCSKCETPVGRGRGDQPGRSEGFCTQCGTTYSFSPKLLRGDLVGGQYEVVGCLAHGGLGWIYLAIDRRVNDRWVVLKGLLDTGDEDALAVAIAERRFLAEVDHPNIVRIINFVEHPDSRTGSTDGYIVMEYVGGKSLKEIADARRGPDGRREPLPVEQAIAFALEALPALGHLHSLGLVYCDFKIDNVIQSEDTLKIIDMGAVRRLDDDGPIYGTVGYQAPEIATEGPSPASDLYTVGRTLAVLTFDFQGYTTTHRHSLPGPEQVEVFARYDSFYRLLARATDPDPDQRFSFAEEMADQLTGVLREVLSLHDGRPRPAPSLLFGPELRVVDTDLVPPDAAPEPPAAARGRRGRPAALPAAPSGPPRVVEPAARAAALSLPVPGIDPADPNAGFLAALVATSPGEVITALRSAAVASPELRLRELRAHIEQGDPAAVRSTLAELDDDRSADWRAIWYRGLAALAADAPDDASLAAAAEAFHAVYAAFPGEAAPKLALGLCAELRGLPQAASDFYRRVWTTDRGYVSAAFGLARVRLAAGDRDAAVHVLESVPETSSHHVAARVAAVRARIRGRSAAEPLHADLDACSTALSGLLLDTRRRAELSVEVLGTALGWVLAGGGPDQQDPARRITLLGHPATERELRGALEDSYRVLARLADRQETRFALVEQANRTRPRTWV
ncbi:tetratricopeptide repeat protein [Streptomyces sp. NPDC092296]|uniref:serine/threonine-protein kinase n=1 Tax=Streptomyces sp. NPDC092296 TaxID=3366012 RepID=UPI003815863B